MANLSNDDHEEVNVTYLLGAGASFNALPIISGTGTGKGINQFATALRDFISYLKSADKIRFDDPSNQYLSRIIQKLEFVAGGTDRFGTPDTYAKFLFLNQRKELRQLKEALSFYFACEQLVRKKFDQRTLNFLTTVTEVPTRFPRNIKIITWNYDMQFELASQEFHGEEHWSVGSVDISKQPFLLYYPPLDAVDRGNGQASASDFDIVHLNGIAGAFHHRGKNVFDNLFHDNWYSEEYTLKNFVADFKSKWGEMESLFTFAWEKPESINRRVEIAQKMIEKTSILVIVGYSFPFFNRKIDKALFDAVKQRMAFKKIIYQDPDPYRKGEFLRSQFDLHESVEIVDYKFGGSYIVPMEL